MRKRAMKKCLTILLTFACVFAFAACSRGEKTTGAQVDGATMSTTQDGLVEHEHSYSEEVVNISEDGLTASLEKTCTACDETVSRKYSGTLIKGEKVYKFEDGARVVVTKEPVTIEGKNYYVINNEIQHNIYVREEDNIYYYGDNGVKNEDPLTNQEIAVDGRTYYVINNEIQTNVYIRVENNIYYYGADGVKSDEALTDREITVGGKVYYVINNEIQINVYIRVENSIYYYGDNGVKSDEALTDREITVGGKVYYVINNEIQTDIYIQIENNIYYYGADGVKSDEALTDREITVGGKVYYVINNEIQTNVYIRVENNIYYYGDNGVKSDAVLNNQKIEDIQGNTYYIINNQIQINIYVWIENHIYYFGIDGAMLQNGTKDGYTFGADGAMTSTNVTIIIDGKTYLVTDGVATPHEHSYTSVVTNPTCTEDGYTTYTCTCGNSYTDDKVEKLGHDYGTLCEEEAPTCQATGHIAYYHCARCYVYFDGQKQPVLAEDLVLEKTAHQFENNVCQYCTLKRTTISGRVYNTSNSTISNVTILVNGTDDKGLPFSTEVSTNSSGVYYIENIPYGTYSLTVQKEGYKNNNANVTVTYDNQVVNNLYLISENSSGVGSATGYVYNAQNAYGISGITIYVRSGSNVTTGDIVMKLTSGASGYYSIEALEAGNYTLQFVDERGTGNEFANNSINVSILADSCATDQNVTLSLKAASNVIRVVLTWGASPRDLDSHMTFDRSHVYFSSPNVGNVSLDVDDTDYYGPETITINGVKEGTTYHYYVYNWSGGGNRVLSNSGAHVTVYVGDEIKYEFSVPTGSGLYWDVFTYSVENGFTIINTIKTSI